jgi:hypothetical protein
MRRQRNSAGPRTFPNVSGSHHRRPPIVAAIKQALHCLGSRIDRSGALQLVQDISQTGETPSLSRTALKKDALDKDRRLAFVDDHGRTHALLSARHDESFRFASVEIEGTADRVHKLAHLCMARLLNAKPSRLDACFDLIGKPAKLPIPDPGADHNMVVKPLEKSYCSDTAKCYQSGRVTNDRHPNDYEGGVRNRYAWSSP